MALSAGERLGPYEILAPIGAGGMGQVYRARDTRLGREVAIKVSAERFSARFEKEAHAIASLNHTNICHLYDVGPNYLVMELVEGETLSGPLKLAEAIPVIRQLIDGIEAAHERNIVHRDLKPANIKITPEGVVKILDFGLAKASSPEPEGASENSPTVTMGATTTGMILGTAAYMSPEQAKGKIADKRSDIWSFGVVLYGLLTGKKPFEGESVVDTLGAVINREPDWSHVPPQAQRLLQWCLEKDRKQRLQSIGDARRMLEEVPLEAAATAPSRSRLGKVGWITASVFALAFAAVSFVHFREAPSVIPPVVRFQVPIPEWAPVRSPVISPDGRQVVYQDGDRLWIRGFDALNARPLAGTEGVTGQPFWSADSRFVIFGFKAMLQKVDAAGGPPERICELPGTLRGGFDSAGGRLLFASYPGGLLGAPAGGGTASIVDRSFLSGVIQRNPAILPDGNHFVYGYLEGIYAGSLSRPEEHKKLLPDRSPVAYVPTSTGQSGYLVFLRDGRLVAQAFHPDRLELAGGPIQIAPQASDFSASPAGALIFRPGISGRQFTWFDRQGRRLGTTWEPGIYNELNLSPDGSRAAVVRVADGVVPGTWIHEFSTERNTALGIGVRPVWSPDGSHIAFTSWDSTERLAGPNLYQLASNGAGGRELLLKSDSISYVCDWSPDGRWLLYDNTDPNGKESLWLLPMQGERKPQPLQATDHTETEGAFSPDGRSIAYLSDESGRFEVYVTSFPVSGGKKWVVSAGGGYQPRWRRDGRELLYFSPDGKLMSVDVAPGPSFGAPKVLFQPPIYGGGANSSNRFWDATKDGQRFLINTIASESGPAPMTVLLNWQAELKK